MQCACILFLYGSFFIQAHAMRLYSVSLWSNLLLSYCFFLLLLHLLLSDNLLLLPHSWSDFDQTWSVACIGEWLQKSYTDRGSGSPGTSGVKNVKQCSRTTKLGQKNRWSKLNMMVTFIEVKGHQRSSVVNYVLWQQNLVRRIPDASL